VKIKFKLDIVLEGTKSIFLSIKFLEDDKNEFEKVLDKFKNSEKFRKILDNISDRILLMADKFGVDKDFFKDEGERNVYRFNKTGKEFRLLCLPYGRFNVIIGGGAIKKPGTDTYQENPEYYRQVKILQAVDKILMDCEVDFSKLINYIDQTFEIELE